MEDRRFRIYRAVSGAEGFLGKATAFLEDRPGSLAGLAGVFAGHGANITYFHYNRSEHPNRVIIELTSPGKESLEGVRRELSGRGLFGAAAGGEELGLLDTGSLLNMEVRLRHRPGTLGAFAELLGEHGANVIYMSYDEAVSETSVNVSIVTRDPGEVDRLLKDLNERGYHYGINYRGVGQKEVDDVIGLNLTERFFLRLKALLGTDDTARLKKLVDSSRSLTQSLLCFSSEAGKHLEAGSVLTNVLAFASASVLRTGENFAYRGLPPLERGGLTLSVFRLPTGGNLSILDGGERVMIDGGYGVYYEDVKGMLRESGIEPGSIERIYVTHADADHAGLSGYFEEEFGTPVYMHRDSEAIIEGEDRSRGSETQLGELNRHFTLLVNGFTRPRFPKNWTPFGSGNPEEAHGFRVVDSFDVGGHEFRVVESLGGHIPGQVFLVGPDSGLVFTGDYLLLVESLSAEEREVLNLPKFMMTSTNVDSSVFRKEMGMLRDLIVRLDSELDGGAVVVPGHGDYYPGRVLRGP
ncbi:MAG: MBL fold metallo-hydrolase [Nitrospirota bacterium]|jgi:glyoxylase-like metal-dependent hydrolase (beta-lactamase superfamily II)